MTDYETIRKDIYESFHDTFHKLYISELKDQISDKDEVITANDHVIAEQQAEIQQLRADLAHADAKGQENDKLLWGTIKDNERLRAALVALRDGCETRPVGVRYREDGQPSKHDKCIHGVWMYEDCGQCVSLFVEAALAQKANDVC
jgi:uncharacterized coiled-coil protein SlyX